MEKSATKKNIFGDVGNMKGPIISPSC